MNEIKDHMRASFQEVSNQGAMTQEGMRGIRFNILDA